MTILNFAYGRACRWLLCASWQLRVQCALSASVWEKRAQQRNVKL